MNRKKHATINLYAGNHENGRDILTYNPHSMSVIDVSTLVYLHNSGQLEGADVRKINEDCFGKTYRVAAPDEVWAEAARLSAKYSSF